jgi:hypothetical protein
VCNSGKDSPSLIWISSGRERRGTDPDAHNVAELLDGIPGALARAELGRKQAAAGETISLDEL